MPWDAFLLARHLIRHHKSEEGKPLCTVEEYYYHHVYLKEWNQKNKEAVMEKAKDEKDIKVPAEEPKVFEEVAIDEDAKDSADARPTTVPVPEQEQKVREQDCKMPPPAMAAVAEEVEGTLESVIEIDGEQTSSAVAPEDDLGKNLSDQEVSLLLDDSDNWEARPNSVRLLEWPPLAAAYDKCAFACAACKDGPQYFTSKRAARAHVYREHGLTVREYCRRYGSLRVMENYIMCQVGARNSRNVSIC